MTITELGPADASAAGTAPALEARGLGRRYPRGWGLQDCTFSVPAGKVSALVGPNGAGKSTLLRLAAGLSRPTTGEVLTFGERVNPNSPGGFPRVGYLDQERPLFRTFRVSEMLVLGRQLNRSWDEAAAEDWIDRLEIPRSERVRNLSIGQQAQVSMALCLGKQPDLLLLDEPVASLDPLARRQLWSTVMDSVAERGRTVVISSHIMSELEPVCDHIVILSKSRVQMTGDIDDVRSQHRLLVGPHGEAPLSDLTVVSTTTAERQDAVLVRGVVPDDIGSAWQVLAPSLEEIVLAYLGASS